MKLSIENFAKIKEADIIIDGITVIAGENNTGKSTVGKILFSLFNSSNNIDKKIMEDRLRSIKKRNRTSYWQACSDNVELAWADSIRVSEILNDKLREKMVSGFEISKVELADMVTTAMEAVKGSTDYKISNQEEFQQEIYRNITEVLRLPEEMIIREVISSYFNNVFSSQINMLSEDRDEKARLKLCIKDKTQTVTFENNVCVKFDQNLKINHKAVYIDNPFIIDNLRGEWYRDFNLMEEMLVSLLKEKESDVFDGVVEKMLVKEKLQDVYKMLQSVVVGEIIVDQNNTFYLKSKNFKEPIILQNLSTGLKSFVILKILLEKGRLKEKDVIILDEPEIHLHPQWQIVYAELIVLLQKVFDLSIVVTTHSPYFVDALDLFSCKHGTDKKVNYYLAANTDNMVQMEYVTDHIEAIYKKMASPVQALDTLRYELNNK